MAVLWKQREMVEELRGLLIEKLKGLKPLGDSDPNSFGYVFMTGDKLHVEENLLIEQILKKKGKDWCDLDEVQELKLTLNGCIKHDLIASGKNKSYDQVKGSVGDIKAGSMRVLALDPDKGDEILDFRYYWFKYMPETFPELARIIVSVLISVISAALTSGALFFWFMR